MTLYNFEIEGGRKHQIRVHSAECLGTPLLMDKKYGYNKGLDWFVDTIIQEPLEDFSKLDKLEINKDFKLEEIPS
jgi:23S rRNA-/tRNA-specific pseudouridylate synthase